MKNGNARSMSIRAKINNFAKGKGISPQHAMQSFFAERFLARRVFLSACARFDAPRVPSQTGHRASEGTTTFHRTGSLHFTERIRHISPNGFATFRRTG